MKKAGVLIIISLLLISFLSITLTYAQESPPLPYGINPDEIENTKTNVESKWDYLSKEWKTVLLKNKYISAVDSFLQKISYIFVILFGQPYSLSLTLLLVIIFWLCFFFVFSVIFKNYSSFSPPIAYIISLILVVIAAQLKLWEKQATFFLWLIFGDKPWWFSVIIIILLAAIFFLLFTYIKKFGKQISANRKKMKELEARLKMEVGAKSGEALTKAVSKAAD
jgi:hypothetical protein